MKPAVHARRAVIPAGGPSARRAGADRRGGRWAIELKVRYRTRDADPLNEGLEQLTDYLKRLDLGEGTLLIFDQRPDAPPLPERISRTEMEHEGRRIVIYRL